MKKPLLTVFIVLISSVVHSQFVEKIFLKDSTTVYTGWIVEQVPQDYIKIMRFKERDTIQVKAEDIWKIIRVIDTKRHFIPFNDKKSRSQSIFLEGLGSGFFYSVNYEMMLKKGSSNGWGLRTGLGILSVNAEDTINNLTGRIAVTSIPFVTSYIVGKKRSQLELGIGATVLFLKLKGLSSSTSGSINTSSDLLNYSDQSDRIYVTGLIGYRYTTLNNRFIFRIGLTPYISNRTVNLLAGISIGYRFK